jgi:hypothetical protein
MRLDEAFRDVETESEPGLLLPGAPALIEAVEERGNVFGTNATPRSSTPISTP